MDALTLLVTGAGAPGIKGTLFSLRENFDNRDVRIIGTDIKSEVVGKYLCEAFHSIPKPTEDPYLEELLSICKKEHVDVLVPQNTAELSILAENRALFNEIGTVITVSDQNAIDVANNKRSIMNLAQSIGVPVPEFHTVDTMDALIDYATRLGWPELPVVVKPPLSNGMRGLRVINESSDSKERFYSEKPASFTLSMKELEHTLGSDFPELLVMEYLPGDEYSIDVLRTDTCTVIPRKRDVIFSGITFIGTLENNEQLIDYARTLSETIGLHYAFGFQFKLDRDGMPKLLESNPRIQGTMSLSTYAGANIIYASVKYALGEEIPEFQINWGTKLYRYWGGVGVYDQKPLGLL